MKRLLTILTVFVAFNHISAQKQDYTTEKLEWINPWLTTSNASGMVFNDLFLDEINSFTDGTLSGYYRSGELKNLYDPESTMGANFNIGSYLKLGKAYLKGGFEYDYSQSRNSTWRGWYDPYCSPFMVADSIPGNLSIEEYRMGTAIAYPVSDKVSLGIDMKYNVGIMAKHKDLRNKNTLMTFEINPSMMYRGNNFNIGFNLGYKRSTEKVEYEQIDSSTEKYLFSIYGLWIYYSTGYSSAETKRENLTSGFNGSITADATFGSVRILNDFIADYSTAMQTETGYNNLIHGQTNKLSFSDRLTLIIYPKHRINLSADFYTMVGNRFLQRQELDPQSNIRVWVTYGGPINYYYRSYRSEELSYTYRQAKSLTDVKWELTAGVRDMAVSHKYKETPLTFRQNLTTREGFLKYTHYIPFKDSRLDISPALSYSFSNGLMNDTADGQNKWQLEKELVQEYSFWQAPKIKGGIDIRYAFKVLSVRANYQCAIAAGGDLKGLKRHYASIALGFTF